MKKYKVILLFVKSDDDSFTNDDVLEFEILRKFDQDMLSYELAYSFWKSLIEVVKR